MTNKSDRTRFHTSISRYTVAMADSLFNPRSTPQTAPTKTEYDPAVVNAFIVGLAIDPESGVEGGDFNTESGKAVIILFADSADNAVQVHDTPYNLPFEVHVRHIAAE